MCGLVGLMSKFKNGFTHRQVEIFNTLLYIDALRGEDSTGAFVVDNIGNVHIAKEAYSSYHTIASKKYKELMGKAMSKGWCVVGHNRKATKGTINDENAHPFWVDDKLVLVHNGTMHGDHKQHKNVEVDSHAIAHLIAERPTLEEALGEFHAAYALIWYDVMKKQMNFLRNSQRPLHFVETENEFIWASEAEMLAFTMDRMNILPAKGERIFMQKEMTLSTVTLHNDKTFSESTRNIVPKRKETSSSQGGNFSSTGYRGQSWEEWADWTRKHGLGCNYGYDSYDDEWPVKPESSNDAKSDEDNGDTVIIELPQQSTPQTYPWSKTHTMDEFDSIKKEYDNNNKIRVEALDYLVQEDTYTMMVGRTEDKNRLYVMFPVSNLLADKLSDPKSPRNKDNKPAYFNLEIDGFTWRKASSESAEVVSSITPGYIAIKGKNALFVASDGKSTVQ